MRDWSQTWNYDLTGKNVPNARIFYHDKIDLYGDLWFDVELNDDFVTPWFNYLTIIINFTGTIYDYIERSRLPARVVGDYFPWSNLGRHM